MRISIIGSGNVATHLAAALKNAGHRLAQVYSRNMQNAALLAYHVGAEAIDDIGRINTETDMFIIAVNDDAIAATAAQLAIYSKLIVHTSGAAGLQVITAFSPKAGVFYPLQTFSKTREINFKEVPLCIEGADEEINGVLEELARSISNNVYRVNSVQRKVLHLAAVFACNFTNHLYTIAQQLLADDNMSFDLLRPLIAETADKIKHNLPAADQTGPAIRNDAQTMQTHLQMLNDKPALKELYERISQDIIKNQTPATGAK